MKNLIFLFGFAFCTIVSFAAISQEDLQQQMQVEEQSFTEAELAQMLAPIALYPDSLLTHILIASTYPIEIVEAHRWVKKNDELNSTQLAKSVEDFKWDASVKALVPFDRILSRLSEDLTWTQQLGDAFLQNEEKLLESIQVLRKQAEISGNLEKMDNMEVSYEDDNIIIAPVEKEIVYVPYYDTRMVYGAWHWSSYPPVYWTPHRSVYVNHHSPFYWHSGIHISFNYFFSAFHWHNRHVVVVNSHRSHQYRPRRQISSGGYAKRWVHQPAHRKGVAYRSKRTSKKYQSNRVSVHQTNKQLHLTQQNKTQRHLKQRLAATKQSSSTRKSDNVQFRSKEKARSKLKARTEPRPNLTNVRSKEANQKRKYQQRVSSKKVTPKSYTKSYTKNAATQITKPVRKKQNDSNKKQRHQHKSMKNNQSKAVKSRHK